MLEKKNWMRDNFLWNSIFILVLWYCWRAYLISTGHTIYIHKLLLYASKAMATKRVFLPPLCSTKWRGSHHQRPLWIICRSISTHVSTAQKQFVEHDVSLPLINSKNISIKVYSPFGSRCDERLGKMANQYRIWYGGMLILISPLENIGYWIIRK